ncbi:MAG: PKD domain-containing protein [Candidatus Lernaella stagnicola]|nr:PKD domain-containing protein [Candidatus Lernaella stagnicola]
MWRRFFLVLLVVVFIPALAAAATVKTVAQVYAPNWQTIDRLSTFPIGFEECDRPGYVQIVTSHDAIDDLVDAGFEVDILIDDLDQWVAARRVGSAEAAQLDVPSDDRPVLDHYFDHGEVCDFLNDLAATYPTLMTVEVVGQSVLGRDLHLVKISDNVTTNENEPALFFENNIHGDEIAAYVHALHIIEWLLTEYGTNPDVTAMINEREIFFVPLTNPDGNYDHPTYGRSRYNENGVDMNRNNGYMWDPYEYNSGPALHSEPETQTLANVWVDHQPFVFGVSAHSGTVSISLPWSYHYDEPGDWDEFDYLGENYCDVCLDPLLNDWFQGSSGMYKIHGSTKDEMYGSHGIAAWTVELSYAKECAFSTAIGVAEDHEPSMLWLMQQASEGLHGVVQTSAKEPIAATVFVDGKWYTFNDPEVGDFHKFLLPGTYDVTIEADGYEAYTETVVVADGAPATMTVIPTPDDTPKTFAYRWLQSECPNSEDSHLDAHNVLGRTDGDYFSIGNGGSVLLDLGPGGIADGAGNDIAVYESYTDGDEDFTLYGKVAWADEWVEIGSGLGTDEFDLNGTGLSSVRYVKIVDDSLDLGDAGQNDGYDLDAIGTPALIAAFSASATSGVIPLLVNFADQSSGTPTSWDWDFGDGDTSTDQNPQHTYDEEGYYTVSLTVVGAAGTDTIVRTNYINAYIGAPDPDFEGTPRQGEAPLAVQFTDLSTGSIADYLWDFGDGATSTDQDPLHTYDDAGRYTVKLTTTGPGGEEFERKFNYVTAQCPLPEVDFEADVVSGDAPLTVHFTDLSTAGAGCNISGYQWSFGDGQTSTLASPTHVFQNPGTYDVQLTASTTAGSDTELKVEYINADGGDDDDTTDDDAVDDDASDDDASDDDSGDDDDDDDDNNDSAGDDDDDNDNDSGGCF